MKLQDFISDSLKQIISGIEDAQKFAAEHGAKINPKSQSTIENEGNRKEMAYNLADGTYVHYIKFNVAVEASKEKQNNTEGKGKLGVSIASLGIGHNRDTKSVNSEQSRIEFTIPICYPLQEKGEELKEIVERLKPQIFLAEKSDNRMKDFG
jgi:hypothetical protein